MYGQSLSRKINRIVTTVSLLGRDGGVDLGCAMSHQEKLSGVADWVVNFLCVKESAKGREMLPDKEGLIQRDECELPPETQ